MSISFYDAVKQYDSLGKCFARFFDALTNVTNEPKYPGLTLSDIQGATAPPTT